MNGLFYPNVTFHKRPLETEVLKCLRLFQWFIRMYQYIWCFSTCKISKTESFLQIYNTIKSEYTLFRPLI